MLFFDSAKLLLTELNNSLGTAYTENDVTWSAPYDTASLPGGAAAYTYNTGIIGTINGTQHFINYQRIMITELFLGLPSANQKVRLLNHESGKLEDSVALSISTGFGVPITGSDIDASSIVLLSDGLNILFRIADTSKMYKPLSHTFELKAFTVLTDGKFYSRADLAAMHPYIWSQDVVATDTAYGTKADPAILTSRYDYTPIRGILKHIRPYPDMSTNVWIGDARLLKRLMVGLTQVDGNPWTFDMGASKTAWNIAGVRCVYNGKVADLTPAKAMSRNIPKNMLTFLKPARSGFTHVMILRMGSSGVTQTTYGVSNMAADCAIMHYNA